MKRTIRQVFGTTRPRDIWQNLFTFDRMVTGPIAHIIYWVGLGLFFVAAMGVVGISVGTAIKEGLPWGVMLALPFFIVGLLSILIGILLWRGACELFMAVMSIAEDLRYLRQFQDKMVAPQAAPQPSPASRVAPAAAAQTQAYTAAPVQPVIQPAAMPEDAETPAPTGDDPEKNLLDDPFFRPRFNQDK